MTEVHEGELAGGTENETPVSVEKQNRQSRRMLQLGWDPGSVSPPQGRQ